GGAVAGRGGAVPGVPPGAVARARLGSGGGFGRALVQPPQLLGARGPAEVPLRELACASSEAEAQPVVVEDALEDRRDLERVAALQDQRLLTVANKPADVRRRPRRGPARRQRPRPVDGEAGDA